MSPFTSIKNRQTSSDGCQTNRSQFEHAFSVKELCVCYGDKTACEAITLNISSNKITAIVGPSGSGKSSFLSCLNRLAGSLNECVVSGDICFRGMDLHSTDIELTELRRRIGMVFQKPNPFPFSIWRNLELPLKRHGLKSKELIAERIETTLTRVELWDEVKERLHSSAHQLSGGQQQRLCIARALILNPEVLLLDEPCSALDPISTAKIEQLLLNLKQENTIVIVTHNIGQAKRIADHVAVFWNIENRGMLIEFGGAKETFTKPKKELTAALLASVS